MSAFVETAEAQDKQTFLFNLNRQMSTAYGHDRADAFRLQMCAWRHADLLAHQKQLENAARYMAYHYWNLAR
jgi:hypothetical protein